MILRQFTLKDKKQLYFILWLFISLLISSCSSNSVAPVSSRNSDQTKQTTGAKQTKSITSNPDITSTKSANKKSSRHIVVRGDTLYSISWNYNLDYKAVARWNAIKAPYVIYPGQSLRLIAHTRKQVTPKKAVVKKTVLPDKEDKDKKAVVKKSETVKKATKRGGSEKIEPVKTARKINWQWPTTGKLVKSSSPISKKGLDIAGKKGQSIKASASGNVVYSGSGLLGYGRLIIIKHNETYLSAYAHNSVLMVKEGDSVASGQQIAKMGQDGNGQVLLHFEIRKNGNPVNPATYLPKHQLSRPQT